MNAETNPKTGVAVPDTATTYERAKPEKESPSKALTTPKAPQDEHQDKTAPQAIPASHKRTE